MAKIVIDSSRKNFMAQWREISAHWELLYFLSWRDIKVRYKQTLIGITWALLQPLLTMIIFSFIFGRVDGVAPDNVPYPVFIYAGLLPWILFAQGLSRSSESLVNNTSLVRKVYFPRIILPLAAFGSALVDFMVAFGLLCLLILFFGLPITWHIFIYLGLMLFVLLAGIGIGLGLSAMNVMYRDVRHVIPFIIQLGLFITPVIYPVTLFPQDIAWILYFNPMAGLIEGMRAILLQHQPVPVVGLCVSMISTLFFLVVGAQIFQKVERYFADII